MKKKIRLYFRKVNEASSVYLLSDEIPGAIENGYMEDTQENRDLIAQVGELREASIKDGIGFHKTSCDVAREMYPNELN